MNEINEILNTDKAACREFDANELLYVLKNAMGLNVFWSWGVDNFMVDKKPLSTMFRMTVRGRLHKGRVYIFLNGLDLFDVYLTTKDNTIVNRTPEMGLYNDQLTQWIDEHIETPSHE